MATDIAELFAQVRTLAQRDAYDVAGAAERASCSPDLIRNAITGGDLVAYKPRVNGKPQKKWLIRANELVAWIERGQRS